MDIVEFLTARLNEREAVAHYSGPARVAWLTYRDSGGEMRYTTVAALAGDGETWVADGHDLAEPASVLDVYDPARVLREVAAQREIINDYLIVTANNAIDEANGADPVQTAARTLITKSLRMVLVRLAAPYAEHKDYAEATVQPSQ